MGLAPAMGSGRAQSELKQSTPNGRTLVDATVHEGHTTNGFCAGLLPFHSPLLRESLLFSFPPLTDMLKFSG